MALLDDDGTCGNLTTLTIQRRTNMRPLPISPKYDSAVFDAIVLQLIVGILSKMILDGGQAAQICGIALAAFWGGVAVLMWRFPLAPKRLDLGMIRFGYLPILLLAGFLTEVIWQLRGVA
jgi:hypothetical protein